MLKILLISDGQLFGCNFTVQRIFAKIKSRFKKFKNYFKISFYRLNKNLKYISWPVFLIIFNSNNLILSKKICLCHKSGRLCIIRPWSFILNLLGKIILHATSTGC